MLPSEIRLKFERFSYTDNPCLALTENYVSIGADVDENDTTYHFIKVGKAKEAIRRCDNQRLKLIWGIKPQRNAPNFCYRTLGYEELLMVIANNLFGQSKPDYNMAGRTECYGRFETPQDAMEGCWKIFEAFLVDEIEREEKLDINITAEPILLNKKWADKANSIFESVTKKLKLVA